MSLLSLFNREVSYGCTPPILVTGALPTAVPFPRPTTGVRDDVVPMPGARTRRVANTLLATPVHDHELARLEADVDEYVEVWTPWLHLRSRFELMGALNDSDDTIGDVEVVFGDVATSPTAAVIEWLATGHFTGPAFFNDDVLVEPTGDAIRIGGTLGFSFSDSWRVTGIRCYFDRLGLIEQLLPNAASLVDTADDR